MGRVRKRARGPDVWMHAPDTAGDRQTVIFAAALTCIVFACVLLFPQQPELAKVSWGSDSGLAARAAMPCRPCDVADICARQFRCSKLGPGACPHTPPRYLLRCSPSVLQVSWGLVSGVAARASMVPGPCRVTGIHEDVLCCSPSHWRAEPLVCAVIFVSHAVLLPQEVPCLRMRLKMLISRV